MLTDHLKRIMAGRSLDADEMADLFGHIMDGAASPAQIAALLVALRMKGETTQEITGAARAMRARMTRIHVAIEGPILDTCGTGGDASGTFNISTAVAFVAAAGGATVAKHGNRAVSSRSGSADVLTALGVNISASREVVERCLAEVHIGFLFAPSLHPAMKHAAPVRRDLGIRTIFNVLGPLTNPAGATRQLLGVFDRSLVRRLAEVLAELGSEHAWVVHSADGLDEMSVCDATFIAEWDGHKLSEFTFEPEQLGIARAPLAALQGADAATNAVTMREILGGQLRGPLRDAVALNAAAALVIAGRADSLATGWSLATALLDAGAPLETLQRLAEISHT